MELFAEARSIVEILTIFFVGIIQNPYHAEYLNCMFLRSIDRFSSSFIFARIFLNTGIYMNWVKGLLKWAKNAQGRERTWIPCREMLYHLSYSHDTYQTLIGFILLGNSLARQAKVSRFGPWFENFLLSWIRPQLCYSRHMHNLVEKTSFCSSKTNISIIGTLSWFTTLRLHCMYVQKVK